MSLLNSCSFNYKDSLGTMDVVPDMIMNDASIDRYENATVSLTFNAKTIEMYDADQIWAAEDISFIQYSKDSSGTVEAEGRAGLMLVDNKEEIYTLGKEAFFQTKTDNLILKAENIRWSRKTSRLSGSKTEEVEIQKDEGTAIHGIGFFADTLSRAYEFDQSVSGQIQKSESVPPENAPTTDIPTTDTIEEI